MIEPLEINLTEYQSRRIAQRQLEVREAKELLNECIGTVIATVIDPDTIRDCLIDVHPFKIIITPKGPADAPLADNVS